MSANVYRYPFLLPNLVLAVLALAFLPFVLLFLPETLGTDVGLHSKRALSRQEKLFEMTYMWFRGLYCRPSRLLYVAVRHRAELAPGALCYSSPGVAGVVGVCWIKFVYAWKTACSTLRNCRTHNLQGERSLAFYLFSPPRHIPLFLPPRTRTCLYFDLLATGAFSGLPRTTQKTTK